MPVEGTALEGKLTPAGMLVEFLDHFGLSHAPTPTVLTEEQRETAWALVSEEFEEFGVALDGDDLVKLADALADLVYVATYTAVKAGIPFDEVLAEVHSSNMTKERGPYWPLGKCIVKGDGFRPPDLQRFFS